MTNKELRKKCINTIKIAMEVSSSYKAETLANIAFDALHDDNMAVVPYLPTPEMLAVAWRVLNPCNEKCIEKYGLGPAVKEAWQAMVIVGDLTRVKE